MPMVIKLDESKRAKCRISEMPGEEKFDLEINMQLNQTAMNQIVEIKQFGPSKENHILNIDAILCDKGDLDKIKEDYRYTLEIIVIEDVDGTNVIAQKVTLNNVAFHNLKHSVSYNGTKIESNNVEIHVYTFSTCNIKPEED